MTGTERDMAISPDGTHVVYVSGAAGGGNLMVRAIDQGEAVPLVGTDGAHSPFIAPDGRWVGFFTASELKRVPIAGGASVSLCAISGRPRGASWVPDNTIVFATGGDSWSAAFSTAADAAAAAVAAQRLLGDSAVPLGVRMALHTGEAIERGESYVGFDVSRAGRTLVTEVWYPGEAAGRDTQLRRGRFPLVLLAHGFCGSRTNYEYLSSHLASWGFLVAAPDFPDVFAGDCGRPARGVPGIDLPRDLSSLRAQFHARSGPASRFARAVRGERAGLVGHSFGGFAVLGATLIDDALPVVVALLP